MEEGGGLIVLGGHGGPRTGIAVEALGSGLRERKTGHVGPARAPVRLPATHSRGCRRTGTQIMNGGHAGTYKERFKELGSLTSEAGTWKRFTSSREKYGVPVCSSSMNHKEGKRFHLGWEIYGPETSVEQTDSLPSEGRRTAPRGAVIYSRLPLGQPVDARALRRKSDGWGDPAGCFATLNFPEPQR